MSRGWSAGGKAGPSAPVFVEGLGGTGSPRVTEFTSRPPADPVHTPIQANPPNPGPDSSADSAAESAADFLREASRSDTEPESRLESITDESARVLRVDRVAVWRFGSGEGDLECLLRHHRREGAVARPGAQPDEVARAFRRAFRDSGRLSSEDSARNGPVVLKGWIADEGVRAFLAEPMGNGDDPTGFVTFEEDRGPRRWTPHARELAISLASRISSALDAPASIGAADAPIESLPADADAGREEALAETPVAAPPVEVPPVQVPAGEVPPVEVPVVEVPVVEASAVDAPESVVPSVELATTSTPGPEPEPSRPEAPITPEVLGPTPSPRRSAVLEPVPEAARSTPLRRLSQLESAALLAAEALPEALRILEVQRGTLRLLEESLTEFGGERELLAEAEDAAARVTEVIGSFLEGLRTGVARAERAELNECLSGMIARLADEAGDRVRLRVAPSADAISLSVDRTLLQHALVHLVRNSREVAPAGSDVRISWGRLYASGTTGGRAATEAGLARIRVEDRGQGVAPDRLSGILEPFASLRDVEEEPRGLGLAVTRAIVEAHGGWMDVKSRPDDGTVVDLFFPLASSSDSAMAAKLPETSVPVAARGPARVLILEDEPLLARLVQQILSRSGFQTEVAAAPAEAERRWRGFEGGLDLVIVERELSGGRSGLDLVRRWQREAPGLRAVVLDRRAAPDAGDTPSAVEGFPVLRRPFDPADVLRRVKEELAGTALDDSASAPPPPENAEPTGRMLAH